MAAAELAEALPAKAMSRGERRHKTAAWLLLSPTMIVLTLVGFWPLVYSLWISLTGYRPTNPNVHQGWVGLDNYGATLSSGQFWNAIWITVIFTGFSVVLSLLLGLGLAFLFNRRLPGFAALRIVVLIPMLITPIAVGITWRIMFIPDSGVLNYLLRSVGLPDLHWTGSEGQALPSLILMDVWQWTPFMFLIIYAGLKALPASPFEAARMDGATRWQIFWNVTLPLLRPVILLAVLLRGIDAVRTYDQIYMTTRGGPNFATETASIYIQRINFRFFEVGYGAAVSWTFLILLMAAVVLFIRYSGFLRDLRMREDGR
ncbi:MAG: carbohydrate ABC transporter permease [Alphaproteobacteria bacterium]